MANTSRHSVATCATADCPDCRALEDCSAQEGTAGEAGDLSSPGVMAEAKAGAAVRVREETSERRPVPVLNVVLD